MSIKNLFKEINLNNNDINMTDKQINIISAAVEIFSEKGFASTSTSEIAKRADVAEGTIFRHYKTKLDLLLAVPEYLSKSSLSRGLMEDIIRIIDNPHSNFEDFLRALIENRKNFVYFNMPLIKVLFQEIPFHPELRDKISRAILSPAVVKLENAIERFKVQGQIIDIPSSSVVNLLFTSVFGYFFTRYIAGFEFKWDDEKETEYLVRYIMNGVSIINKG